MDRADTRTSIQIVTDPCRNHVVGPQAEMRLRYRQGALDLTREALVRCVEHTIEERWSLRRRKLLGKLERLVDYDLRRRRPSAEFVDCQAQNITVDGRDAFEAPVLGESRHDFVQGGRFLQHTFEKLIRKLPRRGRRGR